MLTCLVSQSYVMGQFVPIGVCLCVCVLFQCYSAFEVPCPDRDLKSVLDYVSVTIRHFV